MYVLLAQDGVRLDDDATMLLLRYVVKIGCEPSALGSMVGGISPQDPLFFVLHPIFEKGLHVLWMSPKFRDRYTFAWVDGACTGSKLDDSLPFTGALVASAPFVSPRVCRHVCSSVESAFDSSRQASSPFFPN